MNTITLKIAAAAARIIHTYRTTAKTDAASASDTLTAYLRQQGAESKDSAVNVGGYTCWLTSKAGSLSPDRTALIAAGLGPADRPDLWKQSSGSTVLNIK